VNSFSIYPVEDRLKIMARSHLVPLPLNHDLTYAHTPVASHFNQEQL